MIERLIDYKHKCKVLKQIQSNRALFYRKLNGFQNFLTIVVSGFITFIGFSGFETIKNYIQMINKNFQPPLSSIQMAYNFFVFVLFIVVILHLVFQFGAKQNEAERAISLLSGLINEIEDKMDDVQDNQTLAAIRQRYETIIQIIPSNTDREYLKAKKSLEEKTSKVKIIEHQNLFSMSREEQEKYIIRLIQKDSTLQSILNNLTNQDEELYLGGGVIRNIVWDNLHNYRDATPIDDVDVIYFNNTHKTKDYDITIENRLKKNMPNLKWSVKNQARMNVINNDEPYTSLHDAVSKWPETVSAMLIRKKDNAYDIIAPFGFDDLFRLIVQPTPHFLGKLDKYQERILSHEWQGKWPKLKVLYMEDPSSNSSTSA